jgi:hypothetical protein
MPAASRSLRKPSDERGSQASSTRWSRQVQGHRRERWRPRLAVTEAVVGVELRGDWPPFRADGGRGVLWPPWGR